MIDLYSLEKFMTKFNIKRKPIKKQFDINPATIDAALRSMMVFLLLSIDFLLFTGSGNINLFNGLTISAEVFYILLIFAFLSAGIFALCKKRLVVQNVLVAIVVYIFVYALYNQFAQFDHNGFIGGWLGLSGDGILCNYSDAIVSMLLAAGTYFFLNKNNKIHIGYVTFLLFLMFCAILINDFTTSRNKGDFFVSYDNQEENSAYFGGEQKVVYLFLPNASSIQYISEWKDVPEAQKTLDIINAFYAKNRFKVYPNAYVDDNNQFLNMVTLLNSQREIDPVDNILKTRLLYKYWKFFNLKDEYVFLKRNDLFQTFKNSGYNISAYKSHGFDLCHQKHKINVDRCVEKINKPIKIWDGVNRSRQSKVIFAEWLDSIGIFDNLSGAYKTMSIFSDADTIPLIGINYRNLYVVNSIKTLDKLFENISKDEGNQAYFVFLDIPTDMYIYDEFCQIKQQKEWIGLVDLPWVKSKKDNRKKTAYLQQTQCLYGKLEEFMQKIGKLGIDDNLTVIVQGISGFEEKNNGKSSSFIDRFIGAQLINMAIKENGAQYFSINQKICPAKNILNNFLYGQNLCHDLDGLNVHMSIKKDLFEKLNKDYISEEYLQDAVDMFNNWFEAWKARNQVKSSPKENTGGEYYAY